MSKDLEKNENKTEHPPMFDGDTSTKSPAARRIAIKLATGKTITGGVKNNDWDLLRFYNSEVREILSDFGLCLWRDEINEVAWAQAPIEIYDELPSFLYKPQKLLDNHIAMFRVLQKEVHSGRMEGKDKWLAAEDYLFEEFKRLSPEINENTTTSDAKSKFDNAISKAIGLEWIEKESDRGEVIYEITKVVAALMDSGFTKQIDAGDLIEEEEDD